MKETGNTGVAHGLPRHYYLSEEIYQQELERVFKRQWLVAGHISLAGNPGDYFVKQVGPESMIIAHDKSGKMRAYFNVCRHRGYQILGDEEQGSRSIFVCPYHQWSYSNDGCLKAVPGVENGREFAFENYSLHEAHCEVWYGWICVYLGEDNPIPLADVAAPLSDEEKLRAIGSERLKLAHRETYIMDANWKSVFENEVECYHCAGGHPSLVVSCEYEAFYGDVFGDQDRSNFPLRDGMATFSMDGKRLVKKALGTQQEDGFNTGFIFLPLFSGPILFIDHAVSLEVTPLARDRTQMISEWYVHEDAVEGVDYDVQKLIEVFHNTNKEDSAFAERNYKGIRSARFTPGPLHPVREKMIIDNHKLYLEMMAAE